MNALEFATGKWFWIVFSGVMGLIIFGSILFVNNLVETSYETEGIVLGKTLESHSGLFGGYSNEVCIVKYEGKKETTTTNGCLYKEGDIVKVFVTKIGISIIDGVEG